MLDTQSTHPPLGKPGFQMGERMTIPHIEQRLFYRTS